MSATYDPRLETDKDWVRFLTGDTLVDTTPWLQDEEIAALLIEEQNKYLAAAAALGRIWAYWIGRSGGVSSKSVEGLSISYGSGSTSPDSAITARIADLKAKGARLTARKPYMFNTLGTYPRGRSNCS